MKDEGKITRRDETLMKGLENVEDILVNDTTALLSNTSSEQLTALKMALREPSSRKLADILHLVVLFSQPGLIAEVRNVLSEYRGTRDEI